jgi:magnesium-transporting ATPase (P-type)
MSNSTLNINRPENTIVARQQRAAQLKVSGNASDIALLRFNEGYFSTSRLRKQFPYVLEIPFSSSTKWQLVMVKDPTYVHPTDAKFIVMVKGAPERMLVLCKKYLDVGATVTEIDD